MTQGRAIALAFLVIASSSIISSTSKFYIYCIWSYDQVTDSYCLAKPKIKPFAFEKSLKTGDKVVILCELSDGSLPVTFNWLKDGHRYFGDETTKIITEEDFSHIRIKSIAGKDIGNYTCSASNSHGMDSFTARLVVKSEWYCVWSD